MGLILARDHSFHNNFVTRHSCEVITFFGDCIHRDIHIKCAFIHCHLVAALLLKSVRAVRSFRWVELVVYYLYHPNE